MTKPHRTYMKNILLPCLLFSGMAGLFTGAIIFLFKMAASAVMQLSTLLYAAVRAEPLYLPLLLLTAAALGLLAALLLHLAPECRGGGIPTAVAILRGLITFSWLKSLFLLFASAMLTFLGGLPLGNEGPSVQIGTAIGRGTVYLAGRKNRAWDRYIMTGGACAGFAAATGAPLSGILFAFEEAHRRFSPMIFMTAAVAVVTGTATSNTLSALMGIEEPFLPITSLLPLPTAQLWAPLFVGLLCGFCTVLFSLFYRLYDRVQRQFLAKVPFALRLSLLFVLVALLGFFLSPVLGSGHTLIWDLVSGKGLPYLILLLCLLLRAILMTVANNTGASGGLFIPMLTFGAMLGALCATLFHALGWIGTESSAILVVVGMASFLSAASRTPLTAIAFSLEVLCGLSNILPIALGVTIAYLTSETMRAPAFSDIVLEKKVETVREGKKASIVDCTLTVMPSSFAVGKEIRDILWPPTCTILSVERQHAYGGAAIEEGDRLHVHYATYEPHKTADELAALVGTQPSLPPPPQEAENRLVPDL